MSVSVVIWAVVILLSSVPRFERYTFEQIGKTIPSLAEKVWVGITVAFITCVFFAFALNRLINSAIHKSFDEIL